ncbi:MAG: response regulator transcription factor, partial [Pseudomonadota bacterium]
ILKISEHRKPHICGGKRGLYFKAALSVSDAILTKGTISMNRDFALPKIQDDSPAILFVGDHNCFSEIYLRLIAEEFGHYRILCDRSLDDARQRARIEGPDIAFLVMCCRFGTPALITLREVVKNHPTIHPVLAYGAMNEVRSVLRSADDYAPFQRLSFLPMKARVDAVISILHLLVSGECHVSNDVMKMLLADQAANTTGAPTPKQGIGQSDLDALTTREVEVLSLLAEGAPNKAIAKDLDLSPSTVKLHIHHIIAKLGVRNRTEAAVAYLAARMAPRPKAAP